MPKQEEKYSYLIQKIKIMNLENQLLEKFQVEELEKRYEFSWIDDVVVGAGPGEGTGTSIIDGSIQPIGG